MTDLQTLLEHSVDDAAHHRTSVDVDADLRRGRTALRRRRRSVAVGVVVAAIAVGGTATAVTRPQVLALQPADGLHATVRTGAFDIPAPPDGWRVQAAGPSLVVIAPDDQPKVNLDDPGIQLRVMGKLALEYQSGFDGDFSPGDPTEYDGRAFYTWDGGGPGRMVSVRGPSGGWLVLQEAPALHWTLQQMIEYLDAVVPLPDAIATNG